MIVHLILVESSQDTMFQRMTCSQIMFVTEYHWLQHPDICIYDIMYDVLQAMLHIECELATCTLKNLHNTQTVAPV